jgi:predicted outer membrane repeat protein
MFKFNKSLLTCGLFFAVSCLFSQNRFYVSPTATGNQSGDSWANAFTNLQDALQNAQPDNEIWVAAGTYFPTSNGNRETSFIIPSGVRLFGGFTGIETDLGQRDWKNHSTILSGDIGIFDDSTDNSYNVVQMWNQDLGTLLDGFVVERGNANFETMETIPQESNLQCGGGIYIMGAAGIAYQSIIHCMFRRNASKNAGGAVFINGLEAGSVASSFMDCQFVQNATNGSGAAVYRSGSSNWDVVDFKDCNFEGNYAKKYGAGLYLVDAEGTDTLQILNCTFKNNTAGGLGGGIYCSLGRTNGSMIKVNNCLFDGNSANTAFDIYYTSDSGLGTKYVEFSKSHIKDNDNIDMGSHVRIELIALDSNSTLNFKELLVELNTKRQIQTYQSFWEVYFYDGNIYYNDCTFYVNVLNSLIYNEFKNRINFNQLKLIGNKPTLSIASNAALQSKGICLIQNSEIINLSSEETAPGSIALNLTRLNVFLNNCLIKNYRYLFPSSSVQQIEPVLVLKSTNSIFLDVKDLIRTDLFFTYGNYLTHFEYCCFKPANSFCNLSPYNTCGPGNLFNVDPQFVGEAIFDFHVLPCSPLLNAGDNSVVLPASSDLSGADRIQNGKVDFGPFESAGLELTGIFNTLPACELSNNGSFAFNATQGCPPYSYSWEHNAETGKDSSGLTPGLYHLTVSDARGSILSTELEIPQIAPLQLVPISTPVLCGDTLGGIAAVSVVNGHPPYHFKWEGRPQTDSFLLYLPIGTYNVTVIDSLGCISTGKVPVSWTGNLDIAIEAQEISCPGAYDGALLITPLNGQSPFKWSWNTGEQGPMLDSIGQGLYTGLLTDDFGCTAQWILPLSDPQMIEATAEIVPSNNPAQPNGSISLVSITGGSGVYSVLWSTGAPDIQVTGLAPGSYSVTISDNHGCTVSYNYLIKEVVAGTAPVEQKEMVLYPNPFQESVYIRAQDVGELILFNALNNSVLNLSVNSGTTKVHLQDLSTGIYMWQYRMSGKMITGKLIKL